MQLTSYRDVFKLNSLEKTLVKIAEQLQKDRDFFFLANLLSYCLASRKEPRNQIIFTILSLKEKGVLKPVSLE